MVLWVCCGWSICVKMFLTKNCFCLTFSKSVASEMKGGPCTSSCKLQFSSAVWVLQTFLNTFLMKCSSFSNIFSSCSKPWLLRRSFLMDVLLPFSVLDGFAFLSFFFFSFYSFSYFYLPQGNFISFLPDIELTFCRMEVSSFHSLFPIILSIS